MSCDTQDQKWLVIVVLHEPKLSNVASADTAKFSTNKYTKCDLHIFVLPPFDILRKKILNQKIALYLTFKAWFLNL